MDDHLRKDALRAAQMAFGQTLMTFAADVAEATALAAEAHARGFVAILSAAGGSKEASALVDVVNHQLRNSGLQVVATRVRR